MRNEKDNLKAGIFVSAGLIIFFASIFVLSDIKSWTTSMQSVEVRYDLSDGVQGLINGAAVTLGDQEIGSVTSIEDRYTTIDNQSRVTAKLVTLSLPMSYNIFQDATIELVPPLVGTGTRINIRSVGSGKKYIPHSRKGSIPINGGIKSSDIANEMTKSVGIEDRQRRQIQRIIDNLENMTNVVNQQGPLLMTSAKGMFKQTAPIIENMQESSDQLTSLLIKANAMAELFNKRSGIWYDRLDHITASVEDTTKQVQQTAMTVNKFVIEKDSKFRQTIDGIHSLVKKLEDETITHVNQVIASSKKTMNNWNESSLIINEILVGQRPVIERILANAQLSTDQLNLAATEIRRSPWRLLYTPTSGELETDNLYDASRSFAQAAGALEAATTSIKEIVSKTDVSKPRLEKMLKNLDKLYEKYDVAEKTFWKAIEKHKK